MLQLHQKALLANVDMEWVVNLSALQLGSRWVRLTKRRHPEVDEGLPQVGAAEAAHPDRRRFGPIRLDSHCGDGVHKGTHSGKYRLLLKRTGPLQR